MSVIEIALLATVVALVLGGLYARRRSSHLTHQRQCMDAFFLAARAMMADERTPEPLVRDIRVFALHLRDARVARHLLRMALSGEMRRAVRHMGETERSRALADLPPELTGLAAAVFVNYVYAASYSSFFAGPLLRRTLFLLVMPDRVRIDEQMTRNAFQLMRLVDDCPSPAC